MKYSLCAVCNRRIDYREMRCCVHRSDGDRSVGVVTLDLEKEISMGGLESMTDYITEKDVKEAKKLRKNRKIEEILQECRNQDNGGEIVADRLG